MVISVLVVYDRQVAKLQSCKSRNRFGVIINLSVDLHLRKTEACLKRNKMIEIEGWNLIQRSALRDQVLGDPGQGKPGLWESGIGIWALYFRMPSCQITSIETIVLTGKKLML